MFKPDFKKRKISVPIEDYFNNEELDSEDSKLRFETYRLLWQRIKSETEHTYFRVSYRSPSTFATMHSTGEGLEFTGVGVQAITGGIK